MDEQNDKTILQKAPIEEIVGFINPFIEEWIVEFAKWKGVDMLWSMQRWNMIKVFNCFYNWLKLKGYTHYCITLIG